MEEKYQEVYNFLTKIYKLDASIYSELLLTYGESLVNQVIEDMMDKSEKNLFKFDYYISRIIAYDDMVSMSSFASYGLELDKIPRLSDQENVKLAADIYYIVKELEEIFMMVGYVDTVKETWIADKVEYCIGICDDKELLNKLKKLYNKFLYKRNILVDGNLRLVIMIAKQFYKSESIFNEAVQFGNIGLIRAAEKYDPTFNTEFSTYAYYWIKHNITKNLPNVMFSLTVSRSRIRMYYEMKKIIIKLSSVLHREPTDLEIANCMKVTEKEIYFLKQTFKESISLYEPISDTDGVELTLMNLLEDKSVNISDDIFASELREQLRDRIQRYLNDDECFVIERRFGMYDGTRYTLEDVGKNMGVSRERIRQIEKKAIQKLKVKCKDLITYLR